MPHNSERGYRLLRGLTRQIGESCLAAGEACGGHGGERLCGTGAKAGAQERRRAKEGRRHDCSVAVGSIAVLQLFAGKHSAVDSRELEMRRVRGRRKSSRGAQFGRLRLGGEEDEARRSAFR